jgi:hypothetical protein
MVGYLSDLWDPEGKPQISPLRYAPVETTILFGDRI